MKLQQITPLKIRITNNLQLIVNRYDDINKRNNILNDKLMFFIKIVNEQNILTSSYRFLEAVEYVNQICDLLDKQDIKEELEKFINKKLKFEEENINKSKTKSKIKSSNKETTKSSNNSKRANIDNLYL